MSDTRTGWELWDSRECVSRHPSSMSAHRAAINSRYVSPDSGCVLWMYDPCGRLAAKYVDGVEEVSKQDGPAFCG